MPVIQTNTPIITQINLFDVEIGKQWELINYLADAAAVAKEVDGWISASLHRSLDGSKVVNYAQSADAAAAERVIRHLMDHGLIQGNRSFGTAHPGLYEVAFTLMRDA